MAAIKKAVAKKAVGRPANPAEADAKKKGTPTVVFLPPKLRARVRLGAIALNTSTSEIIRECLEQWTRDKAKAIAKVVANVEDEDEDIEEEEVEEEEVEEEDEE